MTRRSVLYVLWMIGLAAVIAGSLLPASSAPIRALAAMHLSDKLLHFVAYFGLALLPVLQEERRVIQRAVGALLVLGVALEVAQPLSPGRSFEPADMAANAGGIVCGLLLGWPLRAVFGRSLSAQSPPPLHHRVPGAQRGVQAPRDAVHEQECSPGARRPPRQ